MAPCPRRSVHRQHCPSRPRSTPPWHRSGPSARRRIGRLTDCRRRAGRPAWTAQCGWPSTWPPRDRRISV